MNCQDIADVSPPISLIDGQIKPRQSPPSDDDEPRIVNDTMTTEEAMNAWRKVYNDSEKYMNVLLPSSVSAFNPKLKAALMLEMIEKQSNKMIFDELHRLYDIENEFSTLKRELELARKCIEGMRMQLDALNAMNTKVSEPTQDQPIAQPTDE